MNFCPDSPTPTYPIATLIPKSLRDLASKPKHLSICRLLKHGLFEEWEIPLIQKYLACEEKEKAERKKEKAKCVPSMMTCPERAALHYQAPMLLLRLSPCL